MSTPVDTPQGRTAVDPQLAWLVSSERPLLGTAAGLFGSAAAFQILGWRGLAAVAGKLAPIALTGGLGVRVWRATRPSSS